MMQSSGRNPFNDPLLACVLLLLVDSCFGFSAVCPLLRSELKTPSSSHPPSLSRCQARPSNIWRRTATWAPLPSIRMSNVRGIASQVDLDRIVLLAAAPLPNRPDGTLVAVMYSSVQEQSSATFDGEFDRSPPPFFPTCNFHSPRRLDNEPLVELLSSRLDTGVRISLWSVAEHSVRPP